jgi:hypothetical protein
VVLSKDWVFCVTKYFKQITNQHLNVIFLVLVMTIYAKCLLDRPNLTLTYRTPIYIQYIVIRETFNTREGGQDVWGIDSKGNAADCPASILGHQ